MIKVLLALGLMSAFLQARSVNVTPSDYATSLASAAAGDTLFLAAGTYNGNIAPANSGTFDNPIVFKGAGKTQTILSSTGEGIKTANGFWVWEDVWFKGDGNNYHCMHIWPGSYGHITWRNCHFSGVADKSIKIDFAAYNGPTDHWQDYCLLENCTMELGLGGLMNNDGGDFMTCRGNVTYGFRSGGVLYTYFSKGGLAYSIFENNELWGGDIGPLSFGGGSMGVPGEYFRHDPDLALPLNIPAKTCELWRSVARNNVVNNAVAGFSVSNVYDCEIYNNTFINCGSALRCQDHHPGGPKSLKFYNNLLVSTGAFSNAAGWAIDSTNNTWTAALPGDLFVSYSGSEPGATPAPVVATNLALKKTATASSVGSKNTPAAYAVDGSSGTRWTSLKADNQWLRVDLATSSAINRVKLNWGTAYGKAYKIQVSSDGSTWTDLYTTTSGDGGIDDITALSVTSRYVRMLGLTRSTTRSGFALFDFEVYGPAPAATSHDYRVKTAQASVVGKGIAPYTHSTWPAFYGLPSSGFYDLYGTLRPTLPTIGAAEVQGTIAAPAGATGVEMGNSDELPGMVSLVVSPNPANPSTTLHLNVVRDLVLVDAAVYDVRGQHVRSLYYGPMAKGGQTLLWNGRNHQNRVMASGTYLFRVSLGKQVLYTKFQLVR